MITDIFQKKGLLGDRTETALNATRDGYGRVTFKVSSYVKELNGVIYCLNATNNASTCTTAPDLNGTVSALLPAGQYGIAYQYYTSTSVYTYCYQENSWVSGTSYYPIQITAGITTTIDDLS